MANPQGLQPRWHGPYAIKNRPGDSTIEVQTGTYKDGSARIELHSWNNAKPAHFDKTSPIITADRPKLGRPAKPVASEPVEVPAENKNKAKSVPRPPPAPSTHPMTLRHAPKFEQLASLRPWSATKQETDWINRQINEARDRNRLPIPG